MTKISELKFDDQNFNNHTEYGMSLLEKSLRENGAGRSILIDKDNRIIAGNGIVEAAGSIGMDNVEIVDITGEKIVALRRKDITLDSKKGREMAMADNSTAAADLSWNKGAIAKQKEKWGIDPNAWGITDWKDKPEEITEDEAPAVSDEPAKSVLGGVYQLGGHRLMCGDSTDTGSVAILMDGQKAELLLTDPPYNVAMKRSATIINDDLSDEDYNKLLTGAVKCAKAFCSGNQYWWIGWKEYPKLAEILHLEDLPVINCIVWVKPSIGLGKTGYRYRHELCIFSGSIESKSESDVWEFDRDSSPDHPTMKPVGIMAKAIQDSKADTVLDLFGGSGSTLIACEQLGRRCFMMELDPKYCDVIRKRYWRFTHNGDETGWEEGTPAI